MVRFASVSSTIPKDQDTLPTLSEDQRAILVKVWTGAGSRTREAAMVLAREFALQPWQVKAWATHLGIAEADRGEFTALTRELLGDVVLPELPTSEKEMPMDELAVSEKRCSRCKKMKPLSAFGGSPHTPDHRRNCCKDCLSEVRQQREPQRVKASARELATAVEVGPRVEITATEISPQSLPQNFTSAVDGRYEMLYMLLRDLPENGRWSLAERTKWVAAFQGIFEYLVRVEEAGS